MTSLFVLLVFLAWLRLIVVSVLAISNHCNRKPRHEVGKSDYSSVTILVPAYQAASTLASTLASVREEIEAGAKLVVVDDGSTDLTVGVFRAFQNSVGAGKLISHTRNFGKPVALNTGLVEVGTEFVVTLDADTTVCRGSIEQAMHTIMFAHDSDLIASVAFEVGVAPSRRFLPELQGIEYDASLNFERRGQSTLRAVSVTPGAASLWRARDLREIGGFSALTVTEDVDATLLLASRSRRCAHCAGARALTAPPQTFRALMLQRRRWSFGHYQNIGRHIRNLGGNFTFTWITFPNFFLLSALLPGFCVLSIGTMLQEGGAWQSQLTAATLLWLATAYAQRAIALRIARRPVRLKMLLIEPLTTEFFHICALFLVIASACCAVVGAKTDFWKAHQQPDPRE